MFENVDYNKISPLLKQYIDIKNQNADHVLLFRVGDFYECFFDDAIYVSKELELALTGKECGLDERAPMAGIPAVALETYVAKLIEKKRKVAIAEQVEDPKTTKGLVKREVTQLITPGLTICQDNLKESENNYTISIYFNGENYGIAIFDFSTGAFYATTLYYEKDAYDIIEKFMPKEILYNNLILMSKINVDVFTDKYDIICTLLPEDMYDEKNLSYHEHLKLLLKNFEKDISDKEDNIKKAIISSYMYIYNSSKIEPTHISGLYLIKKRRGHFYMYLIGRRLLWVVDF
ncbi:MAG: hypothetical protein MJ151_01415 [Lachnospiraceae bacterium]|nr:hypothetical protein [Lachnospiraceae bacterium]